MSDGNILRVTNYCDECGEGEPGYRTLRVAEAKLGPQARRLM